MGTNARGQGLPRGILVLLLALMMSSCATPTVRAVLRGGPVELDGDLGAAQGAVSGHATADALGLDSEFALQPRVDVDWSAWHLSAEGFDVGFGGAGVADARLETPGGRPIEAGVAVDSEVDISLVTADFAYDVIPWDWMDIGVGAGLGWLHFRAMVAAKANPSVRAGIDENTPLGYLLLRLAKRAGDFGAVLRLRGIAAGSADTEVRYLEADLMGTWRVLGSPEALRGEIVLGYRYIAGDYEYRDGDYRFETELAIHGPYAGIALVF